MELKGCKIGGKMSGDPFEKFDGGTVRREGPLKVDTSDGAPQITPDGEEFTRQVEAFLRTEGQHRRSYHELAK